MFDEAASTTASVSHFPCLSEKPKKINPDEDSSLTFELKSVVPDSPVNSACNKPTSSRDSQSIMRLLQEWHSAHDLKYYIDTLKKVEQQTHIMEASN